MKVKNVTKVACINDISGIGRCSLTIAIPVLSVLGVQACPVPTAVLSCHTGFDKFFFRDMTGDLTAYLKDWNDKKISFDAVYSGFLGSFEQVVITKDFIVSQKKINPKTIAVVDTVMGDNGKIYSTYTKEMCEGMKELVAVSDVITPNVTEACYLTDTEYSGEDISIEKAVEIIQKLVGMGGKSIVITGICGGENLYNLVYDKGEIFKSEIKRTKSYAGTGDLFASCLTGLLMRGYSLSNSVEIVSKFIYEVLENTIEMNKNELEGIFFEPLLGKLAVPEIYL